MMFGMDPRNTSRNEIIQMLKRRINDKSEHIWIISLREWIAALEAENQVARIKEQVDWKYELGTILRRTWDIYGDASPALLFENIKDYQAPATL